MRTILVVPSLLSLPAQVLAGSHALGRLAALSQVRRFPDIEQALLGTLGIDAPAAPLAALGAGLDIGNEWIIRADPVAFAVGIDDVRLAGSVDDLGPDEADALLALLQAHFASDGLRFAYARPDAWFARGPVANDIRTTSLEAATGRTLKPCLPAGPDAAQWRRWMTEIQMLLHEHPLSQRSPPVNGIWFSGNGAFGDIGALPRARVHAQRGRLADLARGFASGEPDTDVHVLEPVRDQEALDTFSATVLAPALAGWDLRKLEGVTLVADGHGTAASWIAAPPSLLGRWLPRRATFALPASAPPGSGT